MGGNKFQRRNYSCVQLPDGHRRAAAGRYHRRPRPAQIRRQSLYSRSRAIPAPVVGNREMPERIGCMRRKILVTALAKTVEQCCRRDWRSSWRCRSPASIKVQSPPPPPPPPPPCKVFAWSGCGAVGMARHGCGHHHAGMQCCALEPLHLLARPQVNRLFGQCLFDPGQTRYHDSRGSATSPYPDARPAANARTPQYRANRCSDTG